MQYAVPFVVALALVLPTAAGAGDRAPAPAGKQGCFFEADFLAKRIKGETREDRAAEARRWYIRRLVAGALESHRRASAMSPVPETFRGS